MCSVDNCAPTTQDAIFMWSVHEEYCRHGAMLCRPWSTTGWRESKPSGENKYRSCVLMCTLLYTLYNVGVHCAM